MSNSVSRRHFVVKMKTRRSGPKLPPSKSDKVVGNGRGLPPPPVTGRTSVRRTWSMEEGVLAISVCLAVGMAALLVVVKDKQGGFTSAEATAERRPSAAGRSEESPRLNADPTASRAAPTNESFIATFGGRNGQSPARVALNDLGDHDKLVLPDNVSGNCNISNGLQDLTGCLSRNGARAR